MKALIVVDIQNDFLPGGALAVSRGDQVIPIINELQRKFELVVATQDWHPANHGSFAANHPEKKVGDVIELDGLKHILWPVHCVQNTRGAEFVPALRTERIARVFFKGIDSNIDSYSAIFDNGHLRSTGLSEYLHEKEVSGLFLAGLATDYCIRFTALDALREGFKVYVIEDACRGVNLKPDDSRSALEEVRSWVEQNGLSLNHDKTHVGDCRQKGQGFDFLGYHFELGRRWVRKKSYQALKDRILTRYTWEQTAAATLKGYEMALGITSPKAQAV